MKSIVTGVAIVLLAASIAAAQTKVLPKIYVTTDPSNEDGALRDRQQSVRDLREAIADRKKTLKLVDVEPDADITVQIIERTTTVPKFRVGIGPSRPGSPIGSPGIAKAVRLRVKAARGDSDPVTFTNKTTFFENDRGWTGAADDISKQIEKWATAKK